MIYPTAALATFIYSQVPQSSGLLGGLGFRFGEGYLYGVLR